MTARQRAEHRHNVLRHRLDMRSRPPTDWQALRTRLQLQARWTPMLAALDKPLVVETLPAPVHTEAPRFTSIISKEVRKASLARVIAGTDEDNSDMLDYGGYTLVRST